MVRLFIILAFAFFSFACQKSYLVSEPSKQISFFIAPSQIEIEIDSLSSLASRKLKEGEIESKEIEIELNHIKRWIDSRALHHLTSQGIAVSKEKNRAYSLELRVLDLGEVRPRIFIEGLSVGLVLGFLASSVSGNPDLGLAVFVTEVIEEIIIIKVLKGFFSIATIEMTLRSPNGEVLKTREFRTYRDTRYSESISPILRDSEEVRIRSSLDSSLRNMAEYLKNQSLRE